MMVADAPAWDHALIALMLFILAVKEICDIDIRREVPHITKIR